MLLLVVAPKGAAEEPVAATMPHWSPAGCRECHQTDTPGGADFSPLQIEKLCVGCHDGKRASKTVHPSYRTISGDQLKRPPADWPLVGDRIGCITCHQVKAGCRKGVGRPALNPAFLRDYDGGELGRFCNNCHRRAEAELFSPHVMLDGHGQVMESACTYCHLGVPSIKAVGEAGAQAVELRHDGAVLCMSCHTRHVDYFEPGHVHAGVSPQMKSRMAAAEQTTVGQPAEPSAVQRALERGSEPKRLPLADGDRVTCITCHNPHQQGVFAAGSVQAFGAIRPGGSPSDLGLRYKPAELCRACHQK